MKNWTTEGGQEVFQVLGGRCNCYLISHGGRHLLVDAGREKKWEDLCDRLHDLGVTRDSLAALVLTHSHFDHAENAANIKRSFKPAVIIHRNESDCLKKGVNPAIRGATCLTRLLAHGRILERVRRSQGYRPVDCDILAEEKYDLGALGFKSYLIHTPGHTSGSMSVVIEDEIALVGDAMFGIFKGSVFPPFAEDPDLVIESWGKLLETGCSYYLPAHGTGRTREQLLIQHKKQKEGHGSREVLKRGR